MPTRIELLTSLQRLDQGILKKRQEADGVTRKLQELQAAVDRRAAEAVQLTDELGEVKKRQLALERELAEIEEKMKDRRMRLQRIRSDRELQATQREIDSMKERIGELEDQELQVMEEAEGLTTRASTAEENAQGGRDALAAEQEELVSRTSTLEKEVTHDSVARDELAATIDGSLVSRYERVFSRRGSAIVPVRDGTCQGCHMNVPPQLYNQILRGEDVFACPSCHRLLFSEPSDGDES